MATARVLALLALAGTAAAQYNGTCFTAPNTVGPGTNCTGSSVLQLITAAACLPNYFDVNGHADDGCEAGCPAIQGGTCTNCSSAVSCTVASCGAGWTSSPADGGSCVPRCSGGNPSVYHVQVTNPSAVSVLGLGNLSCAVGYNGQAVAYCTTPGGVFSFGGCAENICAAPGDTPGYSIARVVGTTVSGLGAVACAPGYGGTPSATCAHSAFNNNSFTI
eukprot:SAG25_NODE_4798_length_747_cov_1.915123_1_plen_218_part_01